MTQDNNKLLYEFSPYQVFIRADKIGYCVLNANTEVFEMEEEKVLGSAVAFAMHSSDFLKEVDQVASEVKSQISVFPGDFLNKH